MDTVKLSIVVLNYNTAHLLRLMVRNILQLKLDISYEIIVVDNDSQDNSVQMMEELYSSSEHPHITLIKNPDNTGHAHGNNLGIQQATGEFIMVMNSDIIVFKAEDIQAMVKYMEHNPRVGMLGPQLRNGDGTVQNSCYRPYGTFTPVYRRTPLGKVGFAQRDLERHLMADFNHQTIERVDWLLGACFIVTRSALDRVGLFNESFFLYFADFELCDRLRHFGYEIVYFPEVAIVHYHRRQSAQRSIWGGLGSLLNYTTRIHLKDWYRYIRISQQGYDTDSGN